MKLEIMSQRNAENISKYLTEKTSIISIVGLDEENAQFYKNPNIDKVFRMYFYDLESDFKASDKIYRAPIQSDFVGLKNFIDNLDCDLLIVHCGAGQSRSAGVAAAINEYLNLGYDIFGDKRYSPNGTVYKCCLNELGIAKSKDYFEEVFNASPQIDVYVSNGEVDER